MAINYRSHPRHLGTREPDGTDSNLDNPEWGSAHHEFLRETLNSLPLNRLRGRRRPHAAPRRAWQVHFIQRAALF
jgi:hypothetical protein